MSAQGNMPGVLSADIASGIFFQKKTAAGSLSARFAEGFEKKAVICSDIIEPISIIEPIREGNLS